MPLNISNVTREGIGSSLTSTLLDNGIASAFGLTSNNNNLLQFYTRFGTNSVFLPDKKSFVIRTMNHFDVGFKFLPNNSKVLNLFSLALMEKTPEDLKFFIQEVELPNIKTYSKESEIGTGFMMGSIPGHIVIPSSRQFSISFLNTEFSLHEHCFYYWLKETISNRWAYTIDPNVSTDNPADINLSNIMPFTKADILISFTSNKTHEVLHSIILTNCFPIEIFAPTVNQTMDDKTVARKVLFSFNNIYVSSTFVGENWQKKLKSNVIEDVFNSYLGNKISNSVSTGISGATNAFSNSGAGAIVNRQ